MRSLQILSEIDSFSAIVKATKELDKFHELIHMRMEYAQELSRGEFLVKFKLKDWVVLNGLFLLMSDGRVASALVDYVPMTRPAEGVPPVMRFKAFRKKVPNIRFVLTKPNFIPTGDCKCGICQKGWNPKEIGDIEVRSYWEYVVFNSFAGRKVVNVIDEKERTTGMKFFPHWIADEQNHSVELSPLTVAQPGMKGNFEAVRYRHLKCAKHLKSK